MINKIRRIIQEEGGLWRALKKYGLVRVLSVGLSFIYGALTQKTYRARSSDYSLFDVFFCPRNVYWWTRHAHVANRIRGWDYNSILDVGGGELGIASFLNTKDKLICTLDMVLPSIRENRTNFIRGNALNLPFKDKSFDVVCSIAVLPLIPREYRPQFLSELKRVGKRVCIYSESVQDRDGNFKGLEWEVRFRQEISRKQRRHSDNLEALNRRRVELDEVIAFLPNYEGIQNCDITLKYFLLAAHNFMGFFARLKYYFVYKKEDNKPPYKGVVATD